MSFAASSFQACRALLSSRTLAHPALGRRQTRLSRLGTRCYSEEKTTEKPPSAREELQKEDTSTEVDPCAEVRNKLKAKEGEAADLIVSIYILEELGRVSEHEHILFTGSTTISTSRFSQLATQLSKGKGTDKGLCYFAFCERPSRNCRCPLNGTEGRPTRSTQTHLDRVLRVF